MTPLASKSAELGAGNRPRIKPPEGKNGVFATRRTHN